MRKLQFCALLFVITTCIVSFVSCAGNKTNEEEPKENLKEKAAVTLDSILSSSQDYKIHSIEYVQAAMPVALSEDIQDAYKGAIDVLSTYILALAFSNDNLSDEHKRKEIENNINTVLSPFRDKAASIEKSNLNEQIFALVEMSNKMDTTKLNKIIYVFDVKDPSKLTREIKVDKDQTRMVKDILQLSYAPVDSILTSSYNETVKAKIKESAIYSFIAD